MIEIKKEDDQVCITFTHPAMERVNRVFMLDYEWEELQDLLMAEGHKGHKRRGEECPYADFYHVPRESLVNKAPERCIDSECGKNDWYCESSLCPRFESKEKEANVPEKEGCDGKDGTQDRLIFEKCACGDKSCGYRTKPDKCSMCGKEKHEYGYTCFPDGIFDKEEKPKTPSEVVGRYSDSKRLIDEDMLKVLNEHHYSIEKLKQRLDLLHKE